MFEDENMPVDDAPHDVGDGAPRQSYNFAPGYYGVVYRADVPDWGAGTRREHGAGSSKSRTLKPSVAVEEQEEHQQEQEEASRPEDAEAATAELEAHETHYKLQSMKWGLVPFWTKRDPGYGSLLKTINCRDDSLATQGGMWSTMKARKRCIVVAQGFYEWLKVGGPSSKEKIPHYVKRKDGKLMCFAGLWDCVRYENKGKDGEVDGEPEKHYTYTVITTDSNKQLKFLHDRMPVIMDPGSEAIRTWLDPKRAEWSKELQELLKPYEGELEVYPVSKEVGKVGHNSPSFIVPVASKENKNNIANFFAKGADKKKAAEKVKPEVEVEVKKEDEGEEKKETKTADKLKEEEDKNDNTSPMLSSPPPKRGVKRESSFSLPEKSEPPAKKTMASPPSSATNSKRQTRGKISATSNPQRSPAKKGAKADGSQKITKFFGNSA